MTLSCHRRLNTTKHTSHIKWGLSITVRHSWKDEMYFYGHVNIIPHYQVKHNDEMLWKTVGNLQSPLQRSQEKTTPHATKDNNTQD